MRWRWLTGELVMSHCTPAEIEATVTTEMLSRDAPFDRGQEDISEFGIDMPGMVAVDRPWEEIDLSDLRVSIPSEDIADFLGRVERLQMREFGGRTFTKLHGSHRRCLVLTPELRDALLEQLRALLPAAEMRAKAFYADKRSMADVLREANAKANGVPTEEMPDLGGHKIDRHLPKERGEA